MSKISLIKALGFLLLGTTLMTAQASRTWVSGVGDDANPCSRTAPCKTFAGAISKTAAGGEIDALDPGGFGAVTITKAITLDGGGGQVASVLVSGTNGIVVAAGSPDVVILRNLRINGIGSGLNGIQFQSGRALIVENCDIFGFTQNGINIATAGGQVVVNDTTADHNTAAGLAVGSTALTTVSINNSRFDLNNNGVVAGNFSKVSVSHSVAYGNISVGFLAISGVGTSDMTITNSTSANNGVGIQAGGGATAATVRVGGNTISGSTIVGFAAGSNGTIRSFGGNNNADSGAPNGAGITPQ
jgi:hypothetical protein